MFGLDEKLEELKQLRKNGLIDNGEYRDLCAKAYIAYDKIPANIQNIYNSQNTQNTQPQRTYSERRTQASPRTQPKRTQNTQQQKKKGKNRISPFAIFIIISVLIGLIRDCD